MDIKKVLISMILFYKSYISPGIKPCCRFYPTCSSYALEAIEKFGTVKGLLLALRRVLRCNPLNRAGYDPVPEKHIK